MSIPQNEPGTDVVDTDKAAQPAPQSGKQPADMPLTEADDANTRTPAAPTQE
ncbi:hypothetical protein [Caballeronia sp. M1242]|uniref:hypothetical protein n=1 Tax=Caballeronia sp. M1242 TaxID=2814653 RepID=UPI0019D09C28|nr:hypothetical protein [Caballeronia sp. M1242]QSN62527.1 hypothetical protein JYK05_06580 [Caballeronia sp. M1242]